MSFRAEAHQLITIIHHPKHFSHTMLHKFLLLAFLASLATALPAQARLNAILPTCNAVALTVEGLPGSPANRPFFSYHLERLTAPGVWNETAQAFSGYSICAFDNLPAGVYRAVCLIDWEVTQIETVLTTAVFQAGACGGDYPVAPYMTMSELYRIAPNPATGVVHVRAAPTIPDADTRLDLYDLTGQRALSVTLQSGDQEVAIAHLISGVYVAQITQNGHPVFQQRLVVFNHP
jgi:hypothetical protein